jgi:K+-transporting ATPase KdpF subunit
MAYGVGLLCSFGIAAVLSRRIMTMSFDYFIGAAVTAALTVYLVYALLRPERF